MRTVAPLARPRAATPTRRLLLAPMLDLACIGLFVLLGRESHGLADGPSWFFAVAWPLAVGWGIAALALRLYSPRHGGRLRLGGTLAIGVSLGLVLRVLATHRSAPAAFIVVIFAFIGLSTIGWRVLPSAIARVGRRRR